RLAMAKGSKKGTKKERRERRFLPRSTTNPLAVRIAGGLGAALLGAGTYAQFGRLLVADPSSAPEPLAFAPWIIAGGAVVLGGAIWFGTSGDPAIHVGDAGIGVDKGALRRMAWHQIESVTFEGAGNVLVVKGKDDAGAELVAKAP